MSHRYKSENLVRLAEVQHCTPYAYRSQLPVKEMLHREFFLRNPPLFMAGDTICLICVDGDRTKEFVRTIVVQATPQFVELSKDGAVHKIPAQPKQAGSVDETVERYVDRDGYTVEHEGFGHWAVLNPEGEKVCGRLDKEHAGRVRAGTDPIPQQPEKKAA